MSAGVYSLLFSEKAIGSVVLKNRIIMPPMVTNYAAEDGSVTDRYKAYIAERARGGVALIILEATYVHQSGKGFPHNLGIDDDKHIKGLTEMVEVAHSAGAKIAVQLFHTGRQTSQAVTGMRTLAPSPIPIKGEEEIPKEMTEADIETIIGAFAVAAGRAKAAGFDAIELHGTHGYIINEFLSPYANRREDRYGGDSEGRLRFALEVLQVARQAVGPEFPIIYRINGNEHVKGGIDLELAKSIAMCLEQAGTDAFHVTAGFYETVLNSIPPMYLARGCNAYLAEGIKQVVSVPVIAAGRINTPEVAEEILQSGRADFVGMGRALLCDPEFPQKLQAGERRRMRVCIADNQKCIGRLLNSESISCILNVRTGQERDYALSQSSRGKNVAVIGGGPAGCEAARVAAARGHKVTLFESGKRLGGQLNLISRTPGRDEFEEVVSYYEAELEHLGVAVEISHRVTREELDGLQVDHKVIATGALPVVPAIPGVNMKHVVHAWDLISGVATVGERVVVVGGGSVGCSTADLLKEQGKKVVLLEMLEDIAYDMEVLSREAFLARFLADTNVSVWTRSQVVAIREEGVLVQRGWEQVLITDIDAVVIATGSRSNTELTGSNGGCPTTVIGDALKPRKATEAIEEGFQAAYRL